MAILDVNGLSTIAKLIVDWFVVCKLNSLPRGPHHVAAQVRLSCVVASIDPVSLDLPILHTPQTNHESKHLFPLQGGNG